MDYGDRTLGNTVQLGVRTESESSCDPACRHDGELKCRRWRHMKAVGIYGAHLSGLMKRITLRAFKVTAVKSAVRKLAV